MPRNEFKEMAGPLQTGRAGHHENVLAELVERIREHDELERFGLKSLLGDDSWQKDKLKLENSEKKDLGWQLRELVRVFSEVVYLGDDENGDAEYVLRRRIEERSPFDSRPGRDKAQLK